MESIAKYLNEENDYFVVKAKRKMVEKLLTKTNHTLAEIAEFASVSIDFVIGVKQKVSADKQFNLFCILLKQFDSFCQVNLTIFAEKK